MRAVSVFTEISVQLIYQSTCKTCPLEFTEKGGLNLALTMVVNVVRLENLVEAFV